MVRVSGDLGLFGFVRLVNVGSRESLERKDLFRSFIWIVVEVVIICKNLGIKYVMFWLLSYIYGC